LNRLGSIEQTRFNGLGSIKQTRFNQTDSVQSNRLGSKKSDQKWPISAILIRFGLNLGLNSLKFGQEVRPKLHQKSQNSKKNLKKGQKRP
jgi:hypothetical protein